LKKANTLVSSTKVPDEYPKSFIRSKEGKITDGYGKPTTCIEGTSDVIGYTCGEESSSNSFLLVAISSILFLIIGAVLFVVLKRRRHTKHSKKIIDLLAPSNTQSTVDRKSWESDPTPVTSVKYPHTPDPTPFVGVKYPDSGMSYPKPAESLFNARFQALSAIFY
jgi:hypothetical protein